MISSKVNLAVVGMFVLVALGTLITALAILAGRTGPKDEYYTVFGNVTGLKYGSQVLYAGYPIGQVELVEPQRDNDRLTFRVKMTVAAGWGIPDDSVARSESSGLLAPQIIAISAGKSRTLLPAGSTIPSGSGEGLFSSLASVAGDVNQITAGVSARLPAILENVDRAATGLANASQSIAGVVTPQRLAHIDHMLADAEVAVASLRKSTEQLQQIVQASGPELSAGSREFRETMESLSRNAEPFSQNLNLTSRNLQDFSRQLRNNPGLLLRSSGQPDDVVPPLRAAETK